MGLNKISSFLFAFIFMGFGRIISKVFWGTRIKNIQNHFLFIDEKARIPPSYLESFLGLLPATWTICGVTK